MLQDQIFDPWIVVIPAMNQPLGTRRRFYDSTFGYLKDQYGARVLRSWVGDDYPDLSSSFDMFVLLNSYDELTHPNYGAEYLAKRGKPVIESNYGYDIGSRYAGKHYCRMPAFAFLWRYYTGTKWLQGLMLRCQPTLREFRRIVLSGVPKMDSLADIRARPRDRKRVLVCPHHTIVPGSVVSLSNFLEYKDQILDLPRSYPDIDWIFRPHPLLASTLVRDAGWSEDKWTAYVARFCSFGNAFYVPGGDAFDLFVNSDAMIQDCSSFLAEYHCVGKPQCYLLRSEKQAREQFVDWGLELLSHAYKAFSWDEVVRFVNTVVREGKDVKKAERQKFVARKMLYNYPRVNEWILEDIKRGIGKKEQP